MKCFSSVSQNRDFNCSETNFQKRLEEFQKHLRERAYPQNLINQTLSEVSLENRRQALQKKAMEEKQILPFVTQYHLSVPRLKSILMEHRHFRIEKQPRLRQIYKEPPIISYKRGKSLSDILLKAVISTENGKNTLVESMSQACQFSQLHTNWAAVHLCFMCFICLFV